mgnify:CR=1 FL=1
MKGLSLTLMFLIVVTSVSCKNGSRKSVCVETDTQPYNYCYNQNTSICDDWQSSCSVDVFGQETCHTQCVHYQQIERCETRYKEVCTAYEYRYYCKVKKTWMTWEDFNNSCPSPEKATQLSFIEEFNSSSHDLKQCVDLTAKSRMALKYAQAKTSINEQELIEMVNDHSISTNQKALLEKVFPNKDKDQILGIIYDFAQKHLDLTDCQ